ncbi:calcium-activated chloride channel-domain-containing protein [Umbelopsis sp. PMI_123]|nr:calcium-activated chloride channel-domain-containing protein [Umbelopsis sp. PMI_123]
MADNGLVNTGKFSHLFPTTAKQYSEGISNMVVDYVILFRYPTAPTSKAISREELATSVSNGFQELSTKLTKSNLMYQVREGNDADTLLIFVYCPWPVLKKHLYQSRVHDFLVGVRVNTLGESEETDDESVGSDHKLTEAERLRLIYEIITSPVNEGGANVSPEVDKYVDSIFPLHNDALNKKWIDSWNHKWLIGEDDLQLIRDHFGEKLAFYFAFLQDYLLWLSIPAVMGVIAHFTLKNTFNITYGTMVMLWSVVYLEAWQRKERNLAVKWGVRNYSKHDKQHSGFATEKMVTDAITGELVPYCSPWKLFIRRAVTVPGVAVAAGGLSIVVGFVFAVEVFLHEYYNGPFHKFLHYAPTIGYALLIPTMSNFYTKWVKALNDWENHLTESSWEYSYTQKIFVANFLVGYLSLFITAWVYIPFGDHILPYLDVFNIQHNHQKVGTERLKAQLIYFIISGQVVGFFTEMILPRIMAIVQPKVMSILRRGSGRRSSGTKSEDANSKELDTKQNMTEAEGTFMKKVNKEVGMEEYDIYADYVEMVIQFGYVSVFSTIWPLTALCCFINNIVELRGDAIKVCKYTRRPIPRRAESIGPWLGNMQTLVWLSSITTASFAYLFRSSTDIHSTWTPIFTIMAIMINEHIYVFIRFVVHYAISMVPTWADTVARQEEFKLKKRWLDRTASNEDEYVAKEIGEKQQEVGEHESFWMEHKQPDREVESAISIIQASFKKE